MATFKRIEFSDLNTRQKEAYNFQKVSAVLADYGYITIRLSSDWEGADFIAQHLDGTFLKVQLKSRACVSRKYENKGIYICFPHGGNWYLVPHDKVVKWLTKQTGLESETVWKDGKDRNYTKPNPKILGFLRSVNMIPTDN